MKKIKPVTTSLPVHYELAEALPVYRTTREWLEDQPEKVVQGCKPVHVLKELLETAAMFTEGNISERDLRNKIYSLLS